MTKFTATFASIAATLLLAGNAMAQMPAAGEGPFVEHQDYAAKRVQKTEVTRAPVSIKQVAVGEMNGIAKQTNDVTAPAAQKCARKRVTPSPPATARPPARSDRRLIPGSSSPRQERPASAGRFFVWPAS